MSDNEKMVELPLSVVTELRKEHTLMFGALSRISQLGANWQQPGSMQPASGTLVTIADEALERVLG